MAIVINSNPPRMAAWNKALGEAMPAEDVRCWPDVGNPEDVDILICANNEPGMIAKFPNMKLLISQRAGIDDILADPALGPDVAVCRAQDAAGDRELNDYALMLALFHHRGMPNLIAAQRRGEWTRPGVTPVNERSVGVAGLGLIGLSTARYLRDAGFRVAGWSRTPRDVPGMECFHGPGQLDAFLARTEILVNLLPVTTETIDIFDAKTLAKLPEGASVINLGRGEAIVDADLIAALDSGHLDSASLDVFRTEPLPADHPFWKHPCIYVLPHTARRPRAESLTPGILRIIHCFRAGETLPQQADRARGY